MREHALVVPDRDEGVAYADVLKRRARSGSMRLARRVDWAVRSGRYPKPRLWTGGPAEGRVVHVQRVRLRRQDPGANEILERGKRVNVALAAPSLDGVLLEPGKPFSFWRAIGRPAASLGYRHGIEVRGGCVVPSLGGGLCLLSNAVFRAAAELGWTIIERHGHTMEAVPSEDVPWGVDATVAWPYMDLRLMVPDRGEPARLGVRVEGDAVLVEVWSSAPGPTVELVAVDDRVVVVDGHRIRSNRIVRRTIGAGGREHRETIAVNKKRLVLPSDLGRSCLTCDLTGCAGRVTVP